MLQIKNFKQYLSEYKKSVDNPEKFWSEIAQTFKWKKKWNKVLEWDWTKAQTKWFVGGKLNLTENCLDRHLSKRGNQIALIWEPNNEGEKEIKFTYKELHKKVCEFANVLKNNGVKKGDRVCIYLGMVPELPIFMLACARLGAVHSVVFAGFSETALAERIRDANAKIVITADGTFRGEKIVELKKIVDNALQILKEQNVGVKKVLIVKRTNSQIDFVKERDTWVSDELEKVKAKSQKTFKAEVMDSEDPLFILYTSGSTGKPKGILHTTAGYMVWAMYTFLNAFQYKNKEIYFCTADCGWITGHTYLVYGPLLAGATTLMFEGIPTSPDVGRFWRIIDKYKVNIFYTSPTAIRSLQSFGTKFIKKSSLKSLRVLGTVGEPINESAWKWYSKNIGKNKCPIVDTWWQTETGGFMISPLAGITKTKPAFATLPLPGVQAVVLDENGKEKSPQPPLKGGVRAEGVLAFKFPWPGIARTINNDHKRFFETYFSEFKNYYFPSDAVKRDKDGNYRITGRVDDVLKVSGHLLGTGEIEDAINRHEYVVESAVVPIPHEIKGSGIFAYVVLGENFQNLILLEADKNKIIEEIILTVRKNLGPIAKPDKIQFVKGLPKTRSGKIMRRILKKIVLGEKENLGDISTLVDPGVVEEIIKSL